VDRLIFHGVREEERGEQKDHQLRLYLDNTCVVEGATLLD
jgi:hypothetical protein